jgi:DNA-binding CsgD family transcriptional regulator
MSGIGERGRRSVSVRLLAASSAGPDGSWLTRRCQTDRVLLGRARERRALAELLDSARSGHGGAIVVRGEAGVGKSALIDDAVASAHDVRLLRATGTEFEMELAFAGMHQLCAPLLDRLDDLPGPQREALEVSFGQKVGAPPDPFLVGLATLTLLSDAAADAPVLCVVDDAQWLDRASARALTFAARRVADERVAVLLGVRETGRPLEVDALPGLPVGPLPEAEARALLAAAIRAPLDEQVRDRIVAEARGNPLALLELAAVTAPAGLAGGFGVSAPSAGPVEDLFHRRIEELPPETRRLLLVAAAEPLGDPLLLWRAAQRLGVAVAAAAPAEDTGLLEIDRRVRFRHPLVRSAVYRAASPTERRRVHGALADVTDERLDPDRRAWHRAQAAAGPDEEAAAELVGSAGRARLRGGLAATAAFLERAAALSPDPQRRVERLLDAVESWLAAGAPDEADDLLATVNEDALAPLLRARTELLRGRLALFTRRSFHAPTPLRRAARRLESLDVEAARETHLDALLAALIVGPLGEDVPAAATAARLAPAASGPPRTVDLLVDGVAALLQGERATGTPPLQEALADTDAAVWTHRPMLVALVALEMWDMDAYVRILDLNAERARAAGALTSLPNVLEALAGAAVPTGRFRTADLLHEEADEHATSACIAPPTYCGLYLAALRGQEEVATSGIDAVLQDATARGEGLLVAYSHFATAVLYNGLADYPRALAAARMAWDQLSFGFVGMLLRELVEAAVRAGRPELGAEAFVALREGTRASGTAWARGNEACCAGLLADGETAEGHYREALEHLARAGADLELARARLLYGEWLRREGRRVDAREQLRTAREVLTEIGADGFAQRAERELRATGQRVRRQRDPRTVDALTPQELHVARLAATGAASKGIAAELFLSPRTVDAHLRSIFRKLGISSRRQLWGTVLDELPPDRAAG